MKNRPNPFYVIDPRCVMGGNHDLTEPRLWVGASCRKCHRTWVGNNYIPTWKDNDQ